MHNLPFNKKSRIPLYRQVKEYLLNLIKERGPDEMLPAEMDITTRFGISRATVRAAIQELTMEGYVERIPGKGTFIKDNPNTLSFATWLTLEDYSSPAMDRLFGKFDKQMGGNIVKPLSIPYLDMERQLMILAGAGTAPDAASLVYVWTPMLAHNGVLEPLDDLYTPEVRKNIHPSILDALSYEGNIYGLAWTCGPTILYYNKEIFAEYAGDASLDIKTFDELTNKCAMIHENSRGAIIPFTIPVLDDELFFLYTLFNFLYAFGGGVVDDAGGIIFNAAETIRAYTWLKGFITRGHVNCTNEFRKNRELFANGKLACIIEGPWLNSIIPGLSEGSAGFPIGYALLPEGTEGLSRSVLWSPTLSVFRQCGNKDLAREFLKFLAFDSWSTETLYRQTSMPPVMLDELESNPLYDDDLGKVIREQMKTALPVRMGNPMGFPLATAVCAKASRDIILGNADITATLNSHAEIINAVYGIKKAGRQY